MATSDPAASTNPTGAIRRRPFSDESRRTYDALRSALPPSEFAAVKAWLCTFYAYQLSWLLDWSRFSLLLKARQIGASHTYAAACTLWALLGETTTVVSEDYPAAVDVSRKAAKHAELLCRLGSKWLTPTRTREGDLEFQSGGRIVCKSSENAGRGMSGNIILDEFAYHDRPDAVWDAAAAVVMHGYRLRVLSTPNGVGNRFHQLWDDPKAHEGYRMHSVTIDEARDAGMSVDESVCWKMARGDALVFDQLFRCSFLSTGRNFFDALILSEQARTALAPIETLDLRSGGAHGSLRIWQRPANGRQYVVAVDTSEGSGGDAGAAIVFERGTGKHVATLWGQFKPWELARAAAGVSVRYGNATITVERNNHGHACLRALDAEQHYRNIFHDTDEKPGWLNVQTTRTSALDVLEQAHRSGAFTTNDSALIGEMRTFIVTEKGKAEAAPGSHDDLVMAAAIGWDVICRAQRAPLNLRGWVP